MRVFTAGLAATLAFSILSPACANRGMQAPDSGAGIGGTGGATGAAGTGGSGGVSGTTGTAGADAECPGPVPTDAGADGAACTAKFNFENSTHGAVIPPTGQEAFTLVGRKDTQTYCGMGALAITAAFSGTGGNSTKGEVDIPIAAPDMSFTGKTLTVRFAADPGCSPDLGIAISLRTTAGDKVVIPTVRPVTASWKTQTITFAADGGVAGQDMVQAIIVQAFSSTGYQGTIYLDEIDLTGP
jgi:hypothetical protein